MPLDTESFFSIILSGFITVWAFRKSSHSKKSISDFEYLGFSALWGVVLAVIYIRFFMNNLTLEKTTSNPFAFGLVLSIYGFASGLFLGLLTREYQNILQIKRGGKRQKRRVKL